MAHKYEKEIEELLQKLGPTPPRRKKRPSPWKNVALFFNRLRPSSPAQLMLVGLGLFIFSLLLVKVAPIIARPLIVLSVFLLLVGYTTALAKLPLREEKNWRGRQLENGRRLSWWQRVLKLLYRSK
ncbi:MAG: hypothetical protein HYX82_01230 [Chloroflexi bacterium]|nr:hypothetical protein [Chloroflexota bacterium]